MATGKKKEVKMRDLKPTKDAKGGLIMTGSTKGCATNRSTTNRGLRPGRP